MLRLRQVAIAASPLVAFFCGQARWNPFRLAFILVGRTCLHSASDSCAGDAPQQRYRSYFSRFRVCRRLKRYTCSQNWLTRSLDARTPSLRHKPRCFLFLFRHHEAAQLTTFVSRVTWVLACLVSCAARRTNTPQRARPRSTGARRGRQVLLPQVQARRELHAAEGVGLVEGE